MGATTRTAAAASDLVVELLLFLCSFAPLFLILAIRFRSPWLEAVCGGLFIIGVGGGLAVVWRYDGVSPLRAARQLLELTLDLLEGRLARRVHAALLSR